MYPDDKTAYAYNVVYEFIDARAVSRSEALQALTLLADRIQELAAAQPARSEAGDVCPECGGDGKNHNPRTTPLLCEMCWGSGYTNR